MRIERVTLAEYSNESATYRPPSIEARDNEQAVVA
jgi:hypothetical protein